MGVAYQRRYITYYNLYTIPVYKIIYYLIYRLYNGYIRVVYKKVNNRTHTDVTSRGFVSSHKKTVTLTDQIPTETIRATRGQVAGNEAG
jgi:hypothetical protein